MPLNECLAINQNSFFLFTSMALLGKGRLSVAGVDSNSDIIRQSYSLK